MHHASTQDDDPSTFLQAENTGDVGRGDFTNAMTDDSTRLDSERFPKSSESKLHGKNRWLGDFGLLKSRIRFITIQLF